MTVHFIFPNGREAGFDEVAEDKYRGIRLPGTKILQTHTKAAIITVQEVQTQLFNISHCLFDFFSKIKLSFRGNSGLRLEALLNGEMNIFIDGEKRKFRAGEYRLTNVPVFTSLFKKGSSCSIFITHYSPELLTSLGIDIIPCSPQKMPEGMADLIGEMLHNPYTEKLRDFYYENSVRELLFLHLMGNKKPLPGKLNNRDLAVIYKADSIIATDLHEHYTIEELSRMAGTNKLKLKRGFQKLFGMGAFHRLIFRRMEQAKRLLEATDKPIDEIARMTGYDTAAGFIHAFRREFGLTPREWRKQESESDSDELTSEKL